MSGVFESSSSGEIPPDAVLECGVCWWQYDPAKGDDLGDVPPGVAFSALREDWRCPSCDTPKSKFMLGDASDNKRLDAAAHALTPQERVAALVAAFERAEDTMLGLPVHNDRLAVEAVGFRTWGEAMVGVMVTPWSMNLVSLPLSDAATPHGALGSSRALSFPSGTYSFVLGRMEGVGLLESCSLFSPMDEFDAQDVARATAEAAIGGLFDVPSPEPARPVSRRFMFTMNGQPA